MAKKEKTPLPDEGSDSLITILNIAAAFVASVTLALGIGIAVQYTSTNAAIMPEETVGSQQVSQPAQGQVSQTGTEKNDTSEPSGLRGAPDDGDPAGESADEPEGSDEPEDHGEPPQDIDPPQADTPSASSTQPTSPNPGTSISKTNPPKSSGTTPANPSSGTNSGSTVTIKPNQPKATTSNSGTSSSSKGSGNWGKDSTTNEITGSLSRAAYWVSGGKSYHFSNGCPSLSKSTNIQTGTLQDALNAGKTDPCNNCAGGS